MSQMSNEELVLLLMATFADEAREQLQAINDKLLLLEKAEDAEERGNLLTEIFREAHSLKGAARAVDLDDVESVAHRLESIFGKVQNGELAPDAVLFDLVYKGLDVIASIIEAAATGADAGVDVTALNADLDAFEGGTAPEVAAVSQTDAPAESAPAAEPASAAAAKPTAPKAAAASGIPKAPQCAEETVRVATSKLDGLMAQVGELLAARIGAEQRLAEVRGLAERVEELQMTWGKARPQIRKLLAEGTNGPAKLSIPAGVSRESSTAAFLEETDERLAAVRVSLADLRQKVDSDSRRMGQVTGDLQDSVRRTRMLPVSTVFDTFPRMVRDLARDLGKQVRLTIKGGDTEVDRSVLEQLKSPLTHMIRNCADHGLESTAEREAAGKSAEGAIWLRVSQRGANLEIEIEDDGKGIDPERIRASAVKKGLLAREAADALTEREALWLIFRPGFSTNTTVTDVSGRGVGMDVVREAVERTHGMIDVDSRVGQGTRFNISLPLSVATTRCLMVEVGGQAFALPIGGIDRIVRLTAGDIGQTEGREAIRVDGRPMALARLGDVISLPASSRAAGAAQPAIVLGSGERRVAFMVDGLIGAQEIAIKQLPRPLKRVRHIAGATIVGSGDIVAILNIADLLRSVGRGGASAVMAAVSAPTSQDDEKTILVADDSLTIRTLNKNILQAAGYTVTVAADGLEAWNMIQGQGCDLVVSDWEMPKLDGCQLARKVRGDDRYKDLPFILVTSLDSKESRERGIAAGADAYIVKGGFDQDKLLETVGRLI